MLLENSEFAEELPVGKFFIHPETKKILQYGDLHDQIARRNNLDGVIGAMDAGWIRGTRLFSGGRDELHLETFQNHDALREVLSHFSPHIRDHTKTIMDVYDREEGGDSKVYVLKGMEEHDRYIKSGHIPSKVGSGDSNQQMYSTVGTYERKGIPEWQRPFESVEAQDIEKYLQEHLWHEYDAKVGYTNTSLFEPENKKFDMKEYLKKLMKKYGVRHLPGE